MHDTIGYLWIGSTAKFSVALLAKDLKINEKKYMFIASQNC